MMIESLYAVVKTIFGILLVPVTVVLTFAFYFVILKALGAVIGPIYGFFVNAWATRGTK